MSLLNDLSGAALRQAANIKDKIESLQNELAKLLNGTAISLSISKTKPQKKSGMSATAKVKIAAAQKLRWAKVNAAKSSQKSSGTKLKVDGRETGNEKSVSNEKPAKKKGGLSATGKAKIAAAQKARWAKIKAAQTVAK